MIQESRNSITEDVNIQRFRKFAEEEFTGWADFVKFLWTKPEQLKRNKQLEQLLSDIFPPEASLLFSQVELVIQCLEKQSPAWHLQQVEIYEEILEKQLEQRDNITQMMAYLARVKVGIRTAALKVLNGRHSSVFTQLELTILNALHSEQFKDRNRLKVLENQALLAIDTHLQEPTVELWEKAMLQLPVLGLLWHQDKAIEYLDKCLQLSFFERALEDHYAILLRHLGVYYRKVILQLCRQEEWGELLRIKRHNLGWAAKLFEVSLNTPSLEEYRAELERQEQMEVNRQMHNYNVSEAADDIDALAELK